MSDDLAAWRQLHPEDAEIPGEVIERTFDFAFFALTRRAKELLDALTGMLRR